MKLQTGSKRGPRSSHSYYGSDPVWISL